MRIAMFDCLDDDYFFGDSSHGPNNAFIMGEDGLVRHFEGYWDQYGNPLGYGSFPKVLGTFRIGKKSETKPSGKITCVGLSEDYRGFTLAEDECLIRVPDNYDPR